MKQLAVQMVGVAVIAQVQPHDLETAVKELLAERKNVQGFSTAFPTVQQHGHPPCGLRWAGVKTLQADAVTAIEQDRLLGGDQGRRATRDRSPSCARTCEHRLQVFVPEPPRWLEIGAVIDHGGTAPKRLGACRTCAAMMRRPQAGFSNRLAHANFDAVVDASCAIPLSRGEIARDGRVLDRNEPRIAHGRLDLQRSVGRMADVASEVGECERGMLRGRQGIF